MLLFSIISHRSASEAVSILLIQWARISPENNWPFILAHIIESHEEKIWNLSAVQFWLIDCLVILPFISFSPCYRSHKPAGEFCESILQQRHEVRQNRHGKTMFSYRIFWMKWFENVCFYFKIFFAHATTRTAFIFPSKTNDFIQYKCVGY